ncbi:hypothetical protein ACPPVO_43795 [Dactylosporangium sp. McL0621]|uniref:hypothetical protein n=1 Tax=Dactylosporangium sp. McL0621 TaxID=3415678 RepID=UPI003CEC1A96
MLVAPNARHRQILELLFQRKTTITHYCGNVSSYPDWVMNASRMLRNQILRSDSDGLFLLVSLAPSRSLRCREEEKAARRQGNQR